VKAVAAGEFRLRICYRKKDRLRFLSHLEVSRALERTARRAEIPYAVTRGFTPRLKAAFGPALPVGTAGEREYWDIWMSRYVPAEEILGRLEGAAPQDLEPVETAYVSERLPSLSAACTIGVYEVVVEGEGLTAEQVQSALDGVVADGEIKVERKGKTKVFNLASSLPKEARARSHGQEIRVSFTTRMGPQGSLRPETLIDVALDRAGLSGTIRCITRTDTLIEEEGGMRRPL
jgi:radical SAM-linked protein